jgi:AraC-like DNA-binding protein
MLVFGWRTAVLALVSLQVLTLAVALLRAPRNRAANRRLAALLLVLVGLLTPYTIGFAGFYDAWPWLSFAPFAMPLAVGPLAFAYVCAWTGQPMRPRLAVHLAPAALHLAYGLACFALPLPQKLAWAEGPDGRWITPAIAILAPLSLGAYTWAAAAALVRYRRGLAQVVTDEARYAQAWLQRALAALVVVLAAWAGFQVWELASGGLSYFQRLNLHLLLAALALYLAVEGWRHAGLRLPALPGPVSASTPARDWRATAEAWAAQIDAAGWWRDPDLSLPDLAARLGTNTHYLSRALNEGLGLSFAAFVNGRRARAVAQAIAQGDPRPVLDLALDAGFNSKASFNRAFLAEFGETPSQVRRRQVSEPKLPPDGRDLRRTPL